MRRSSWIVLGVCLCLAALLGFAYVQTRPSSRAPGQQEAFQMLHDMQHAVASKNVSEIMSYIAPGSDIRIANLTQDQLRLMLTRAFRDTGGLQADVKNVAFDGQGDDATMAFDLAVSQHAADLTSADYNGHITLHLKAMDVSHMLGLSHSKEWKIVGAETTGPDPGNFGDY